jgi:hypothetical protein
MPIASGGTAAGSAAGKASSLTVAHRQYVRENVVRASRNANIDFSLHSEVASPSVPRHPAGGTPDAEAVEGRHA